MSEKKQVVIVSGLAGSGKTAAIHALEDLGYYCIDNLPAVLLPAFVEPQTLHAIKSSYIALALDSRDPAVPLQFSRVLPQLKALCDVQVLYLEAAKEVILKRFRETRRHHPIHGYDPHVSLQEAIHWDEVTLEPMKNLADRTLDTSFLRSQNLKDFIHKYFAPSELRTHVLLNLVSFGFKHGVPYDVDTLLDVRCFRNPHYEKDLKPFTGLEKAVKDFVFADPHVPTFIEKIKDMVDFLYPLYRQEGKRYFSLGIGCTGGQHRSVAIVEELARLFRQTYPLITVDHRHIHHASP